MQVAKKQKQEEELDKTQRATCQQIVLVHSEKSSCKPKNDRPSVENTIMVVEYPSTDSFHNKNNDNRTSNHSSGQ